MLVEKTLKRQALFWDKVNIIHDEDSCWPWTGATNENGYGIIDVTVDGKQKRNYAHRVSWEWENDTDIPDKMLVRHKCDNPPCVRPSHLLIGTNQDNTNDKMERGRYVSAVAEIDETTAVEIRHLRAEGMSSNELASRYDFSVPHINAICRGVYWPNAGGPLTTRFIISDSTIYSVLSDVKLLSYRAAAIKHGISYPAVLQIASGKRLPKGPPPSEYYAELLNEVLRNNRDE